MAFDHLPLVSVICVMSNCGSQIPLLRLRLRAISYPTTITFECIQMGLPLPLQSVEPGRTTLLQILALFFAFFIHNIELVPSGGHRFLTQGERHSEGDLRLLRSSSSFAASAASC
jgi:hypothetical protein